MKKLQLVKMNEEVRGLVGESVQWWATNSIGFKLAAAAKTLANIDVSHPDTVERANDAIAFTATIVDSLTADGYTDFEIAFEKSLATAYVSNFKPNIEGMKRQALNTLMTDAKFAMAKPAAKKELLTTALQSLIDNEREREAVEITNRLEYQAEAQELLADILRGKRGTGTGDHSFYIEQRAKAFQKSAEDCLSRGINIDGTMVFRNSYNKMEQESNILQLDSAVRLIINEGIHLKIEMPEEPPTHEELEAQLKLIEAA